MPTKPARPCRWSGCDQLVKDGSGYCTEHLAAKHKQIDERRGNSKQRGYDSQWVKARDTYLKSHPLCAECEKRGEVVQATLVHHVVSLRDGGARLDPENLMPLCIKCHDAIHQQQGDKWK